MVSSVTEMIIGVSGENWLNAMQKTTLLQTKKAITINIAVALTCANNKTLLKTDKIGVLFFFQFKDCF